MPNARANVAIAVSALALAATLAANVVTYQIAGDNRDSIGRLKGLEEDNTAQIAAIEDALARLADAKAGICALREDVQLRQKAAVEFLEDNPDMDPIIGIPRAVIEKQVEDRAATIRALDRAKCGEG